MNDATQDLVESVLEDAVSRLLCGESVDIDAIASAHPKHAEAIRSRWRALQKLRDPLGPILEFAPPVVPAVPFVTRIGTFEIIREIGRGGMGIVYEARQKNPDRLVALKVIRSSHFVDDQALRMFQREIAALARLKHPGIAAIYEAGATPDGQHYFAMELVQGTSLLEFVRRAKLTLKQLLNLFLQICDAINYAHQRGVIHRDIKPANILVEPNGSAKVLDFGLARITDSDVNITGHGIEAGRIQGTLPYMSPEQAQALTDQIDIRTDVYSLGVILFEILTGQLPYELSCASIPQAVRTICETPPRRASSLLPRRNVTGLPAANGVFAPDTSFSFNSAFTSRELRGDIDTILFKSLEKEPSRRYQSALALADEVRRYIRREPLLAHPPSLFYVFNTFVRRHRTASVLAVASISVLIIFVFSLAILTRRLARERDGAQRARNDAVTAEITAKKERDSAQKATADAISARRDAENSEMKARSERRKALDSAENAKNSLEFLVNTFDLSDFNLKEAGTVLALDVLDKGTERANLELNHDPSVQASVLLAIGDAFLKLQRFDRAKPLLSKSYSIRKDEFSEHSLECAEVLDRLGTLQFALGDYLEARRILTEALQIRISRLGKDHSETASSYYDLGRLLTEIGEYAESKKMLQEALAIQIKNPDENIYSTLATRQALASLEFLLGNFAEAEDSLRGCLEDTTRLWGAESIFVADCKRELAFVLFRRGKTAESEKLCNEALTVLNREAGEKHTIVASVLSTLGLVRTVQGDLDSAEGLLRRAIEIGKNAGADGRLQGIMFQAQLAEVLLAGGKYREARETLEDAHLSALKTVGRDHLLTLAITANLGLCIAFQGEPSRGESILNEVVEARTRLLGNDHADTALAKFVLGRIKLQQGNNDGAKLLFEEALPTLRSSTGLESIWVLRCEQELRAAQQR